MYLLDTDVLSELVKRRPSPHVLARLRRSRADTLYTTVISVMELRYGCARRPDSERFWARLEREILARVQVLGFGADDAIVAGDLLAALSTKGTRIGLEDTLIASVALVRRYVVVTRNVRHFARISSLRVENWFEP